VSAAPAALSSTNVVKRYMDGERRIEAVAGVTIEVPRGALWVLRGPSGSGKTTLLGLLGGMIVPTSGDVRILDQPIAKMRDHHRARLRRRSVGFVFQELGLIQGMRVLENVLLPLAPGGGARPDDVGRARALLDRFGVASHAGTRVERLSAGERQRAAIARALVMEPAVLLLDEPTAHLDGARVREVIDVLAAIRDEGKTVLATTHDPRLAGDARVDRVVDMLDGRIEAPVQPS